MFIWQVDYGILHVIGQVCIMLLLQGTCQVSGMY